LRCSSAVPAERQVVRGVPAAHLEPANERDLPEPAGAADHRPIRGAQLADCAVAAGANATVNVDLIPPGTDYAARLYQTDFRTSKKFTLGRMKLTGNLDFFNLFNANPPIHLVTTYGAAWQRPIPILLGRVIKVGGQLEF
jgi:hypothetical protein